MGDIIQFKRGCRGCANLTRINKDTWTCAVRDWSDGTSIYPVVDGKYTEDSGACNGEEYVSRRTSGRRKSI